MEEENKVVAEGFDNLINNKKLRDEMYILEVHLPNFQKT